MSSSRITFADSSPHRRAAPPAWQHVSPQDRRRAALRASQPRDDRDFYEERTWDVARSRDQFVRQGRFMPSHAECTSLLHDIVEHLNYEPGHLNFEDYCEFCKEALRTSGLAPKHEELRELFDLIDADESGTLERHEIMHAVMGDWDVRRLLGSSKTLQPLASVGAWKRAFALLKQPDRRLAATRVLKRLSSDPTCARAIAEYKVERYEAGDSLTRPVIHAMMPLLTATKGAEVATNVAVALGNLAWHENVLQEELSHRYSELFWEFTGGEDFERDPTVEGGFIPLLCGGGGTAVAGGARGGRRGGRRGAVSDDKSLTLEQRGEVAQAVHNMCFMCSENKETVVQHYDRVLRRTLLALAGNGMPLSTRRSSNALICLLDLKADHYAEHTE